MVFHSKKDGLIWVVLAFIFVIYGGVASLIFYQEKDPIIFLVMSLVWVFLGILIAYIIPKTTYYTFLEDHLLCQSLFIKKRIPYRVFKKIEPSNGLYAGWKMSTAWKCLVVHFNKYDELLISPANEEEFIKMFNEKKAQFSELN